VLLPSICWFAAAFVAGVLSYGHSMVSSCSAVLYSTLCPC
jgi:thiamine transporter ThiT